MTLLDVSLHRRHAALWLECERLETELKAKTAELANLGRLLSDSMVDVGVLSLPFEAGDRAWTHYLHTSFSMRRRGEVDSDGAVAALESSGLEWMLRRTHSPQTLTSWAKEELAAERPLPEALGLAFYAHSEHELRLRGATKKRSAAAKAASFYRRQAAARIQETKTKETRIET